MSGNREEQGERERKMRRSEEAARTQCKGGKEEREESVLELPTVCVDSYVSRITKLTIRHSVAFYR